MNDEHWKNAVEHAKASACGCKALLCHLCDDLEGAEGNEDDKTTFALDALTEAIQSVDELVVRLEKVKDFGWSR